MKQSLSSDYSPTWELRLRKGLGTMLADAGKKHPNHHNYPTNNDNHLKSTLSFPMHQARTLSCNQDNTPNCQSLAGRYPAKYGQIPELLQRALPHPFQILPHRPNPY
jgi:hypothetical protein